jgi:hypothetical protein
MDRSHIGVFAVAATGHQVSDQGIAIYIVKDGQSVSRQLSPDERREFHDLMESDLNRSASTPANLEARSRRTGALLAEATFDPEVLANLFPFGNLLVMVKP